MNDFGLNWWDVTDLVREIVGGEFAGVHGFRLSPSANTDGLIRVPSHESGASGFTLVTDVYEMTLDVTTDTSGLSTLSVAGAVPGRNVHYYGGTGAQLSQSVAQPPEAWVDVATPKQMGYGPPNPDGTDTHKENLAQRYPGAASVWVQAVSRDGDRFLLSNPVEVALP